MFIVKQELTTELLLQTSLSPMVAITLAQALSAIIVIVLFACLRWYVLPKGAEWRQALGNGVGWGCVLMAAALILPLQYLESFIATDMPENYAQLLQAIMDQPLGFLVIAVFVPIAEEGVFRGAILRKLLEYNAKPIVPILVSAVIFGAVHGNLAQFLNAFLMGIVLGFLYYRTRSILPGIIVHLTNNGIAYILYRLFPEHADDDVLALFEGHEKTMYASIVISIIVAYIVIRWIYRRQR